MSSTRAPPIWCPSFFRIRSVISSCHWVNTTNGKRKCSGKIPSWMFLHSRTHIYIFFAVIFSCMSLQSMLHCIFLMFWPCISFITSSSFERCIIFAPLMNWRRSMNFYIIIKNISANMTATNQNYSLFISILISRNKCWDMVVYCSHPASRENLTSVIVWNGATGTSIFSSNSSLSIWSTNL